MLIRSITLFNFSKIKSESIFQMAEYNSFNYDFNKTEPYYDRNNDIITFKKDTVQHYIKKVNVTLPAREKLKESSFREDFFNNYDTSFANFCGIDKNMYIEIYDKSQFVPTIDQLGDIKVNVDNIIKNLDNFSEHKRLKIHRSVFKKDKKLKIKEKKDNLVHHIESSLFQAADNIPNSMNDNVISLEENELDDKNKSKNKNSSKNNKINSLKLNGNINNNSENNNKSNEKKTQDRTLLNIKRKLKNISIIKKNEDLINTKIKNEPKELLSIQLDSNINGNIQGYAPNNDLILSNNNKSLHQVDSSNVNKNNIFSFSSKAIQDLSNNSLKKDNQNYPLFTPLNILEPNNILGVGNNNNNFNFLRNNSILSPFSYAHGGFHSILSPNVSINSPFNINNYFHDAFNFTNNYGDDNEESQDNDNNNNIVGTNNKNGKDNTRDNN